MKVKNGKKKIEILRIKMLKVMQPLYKNQNKYNFVLKRIYIIFFKRKEQEEE